MHVFAPILKNKLWGEREPQFFFCFVLSLSASTLVKRPQCIQTSFQIRKREKRKRKEAKTKHIHTHPLVKTINQISFSFFPEAERFGDDLMRRGETRKETENTTLKVYGRRIESQSNAHVTGVTGNHKGTRPKETPAIPPPLARREFTCSSADCSPLSYPLKSNPCRHGRSKHVVKSGVML